jgi:hypothetical protein
MRKHTLASVALLGTLVVTACTEAPLEPSILEEAGPNLSVTTGETFSYIKITSPSSSTTSLTVGGSTQMAGTLFYSKGGTLPAVPYAQWRSTDPCVATVTNASPSWGLVKGMKSGTTRIIAEAWGKADTVTVTVTGTGDLSPGCADQQWVWDYKDVSFTGSPATKYHVASGERLRQVVLFAGPKPDYTIKRRARVTLTSELWYNKGGKLNGSGYVTFSTLDSSVATISSTGELRGRGVGRTKVIARLGTMTDTVPIYVVR